MRKIILIALLLAPVFVIGQTRIRDLSTQATYDGSLYVPCDKAGFAQTKKIALSVLTGAEATLRKTQDTLTRRAVGISDSGYYLTDEGTNYLTSASMAGYDTNSVMTAIHMLDSILYKTNSNVALWDTGDVSTSTIRDNAANRAVAAYSFATNYSNVAERLYSSAFGYKSVAHHKITHAIGGGTYMTDFGANQVTQFVARGGTTNGTADTLEIDDAYPLTIPTDAVIGFEITIVGVQYAGAAGKIDDAFFQKWEGVIRNTAGTTALIGTADSTTAKRSTVPSVTVAVTADNTLDQLNIIVDSEVNTTFYFTAYIRFTWLGFRNFALGY